MARTRTGAKQPLPTASRPMQRRVAAAAHLSCLPQELLDRIFSLLDFSSLRAVATTNDRLNRVATHRLCRSVDLTSTLRPTEPLRKHKASIKRIVTGFSKSLRRDAGRIANVATLAVPVASGVNSALFSVIRTLRPTLKTLVLRQILAPRTSSGAKADTLCHRLRDLGTWATFPNLTELRIELAEGENLPDLGPLRRMTPKLRRVCASQPSLGDIRSRMPVDTDRPPVLHPLSTLEISYPPHGLGKLGLPRWVPELLQTFRHMKSLDFFREHHEADFYGHTLPMANAAYVAKVFRECMKWWEEDPSEIRWHLPGSNTIGELLRCGNLPRLKVFGATESAPEACTMQIETVHIPAHQNLETLFVGVYLEFKTTDVSDGTPQDWPKMRRLSDRIVKKLDAAPKLSSIQYVHPSDHWDVQPACEWDSSGRMGIAIATLHHGDQALYIVKSRTRSIRTAIIRGPPGQGGTAVISATDRKDENPFDAVATPIWQYATNYSGHRVPYSVLAEMAKVEGVDEWIVRNVQVSHKAWEVLERWFEARAGEGRTIQGHVVFMP